MLPKKELPWKLPRENLAKHIRGEAEFVTNVAMEAGTHFETTNLKWFGYCASRHVHALGDLTVDDERPWLGASLDGWSGPGARGAVTDTAPRLWTVDDFGREVRGLDAQGYLRELPLSLVEMKQTVSKNRSRWNKPSPPPYYWNQVQHQMLVSGYELGMLVCKVDAYELYVHVIEADPEYQARLEATCREFWEEYLREPLDSK